MATKVSRTPRATRKSPSVSLSSRVRVLATGEVGEVIRVRKVGRGNVMVRMPDGSTPVLSRKELAAVDALSSSEAHRLCAASAPVSGPVESVSEVPVAPARPRHGCCDPRNPACVVLPRTGGCLLILEKTDGGKYLDWRVALGDTEYGTTLAGGSCRLDECYIVSAMAYFWTLHTVGGWLDVGPDEARVREIAAALGVEVRS